MAKVHTALSADTLNVNILKAEYAVRGEIVQRAAQIGRELEEGVQYPFDKVVNCNIGNPQVLGQKPITFFRQVGCCAACGGWRFGQKCASYGGRPAMPLMSRRM